MNQVFVFKSFFRKVNFFAGWFDVHVFGEISSVLTIIVDTTD